MNTDRYNKLKDARAARYEPEAQQLLAHVYWAALIVTLVLISVAGISYGVYEFKRPLQPAEGDVVVGGAKAPLNRVELQAVLDGFDSRTGMFDERRAAPLVRDPS